MPIKVFIQTDKFEGGPAIFRSRLINALDQFRDIKVVTEKSKKFDIELVFIRNIYKHNKPYIIRVDGCYYEKQREKNNTPLKKSILNAKHVIFQSNFSFQLCKSVLDIDDKTKKKGIDYSIIYNGIDLNYIKQIKPKEGIEPGSFVSCAGWRPNKRPFSTINGFLKADTGRHLYIIGGSGFTGKDIGKKYDSKYIHFLGEKSNKNTISIMKACDYQIHLCHIDSCPNSVIEGLSCGLNVLCTNLGGTSELVGKNGVILNADQRWEGKYLDIDDLDNIPSSVVVKGIRKIMKINKKIDTSIFDINKVALKYREVIKKVINQ